MTVVEMSQYRSPREEIKAKLKMFSVWREMQPEEAVLLVKAGEKFTLYDLSQMLGCSVSTARRRLVQARSMANRTTADLLEVEATHVEKQESLLDILLKNGHISQAEIDARATSETEITRPGLAVKAIMEIVEASGGRLTQKQAGAIWGKSGAWACQNLK